MDPEAIKDVVTTISTAVSSGKKFLDLIRNLSTKAKESGETEILDGLIQIRLEMLALIEENATLKERIRELEKERKVEAHYGGYWVRDEDGSIDGPFDFGSWDKEKKLERYCFYKISEDHAEFGHGYATVVAPLDFLREQKYRHLAEIEEQGERKRRDIVI